MAWAITCVMIVSGENQSLNVKHHSIYHERNDNATTEDIGSATPKTRKTKDVAPEGLLWLLQNQ